LEVDSTCEVKQAGINAESREAVADPGYDYPNGLLDFAVDCGASGFTATVTQYYYDVAPSQLSLRKYNPTSKTYSTVHAATITTKNVYGRTVTTVGYEVTDGGELDQDGVENGVIVDPAGLAVPVARPATAADLAATGGPYALLLGVGSILLVTGVVLRTTARRRSF
jgi:hypothetical protein